ncbi:MAG: CHAT domain-containing protein [Proteobacteria bacterium]|nr:CHAT domain-containing protein [Pseudomonadota bacterium]
MDRVEAAVPDGYIQAPASGTGSAALGRISLALFCAGLLSLDGQYDKAERVFEAAHRQARSSSDLAVQFYLPRIDLMAAQRGLSAGDLGEARRQAEAALDHAHGLSAIFDKYLRAMKRQSEDETGYGDEEGSARRDADVAESRAVLAGIVASLDVAAHGLLANIYEQSRPPDWARAEREAAAAEDAAASLPPALSLFGSALAAAQVQHAYTLEGLKRYDAALQLIRKAMHQSAGPPQGLGSGDAALFATMQTLIAKASGNTISADVIRAVALFGVGGAAPSPDIAAELFETIQVLHENNVGDIARTLTAKLATGSDAFAALLREREDRLAKVTGALTNGNAIDLMNDVASGGSAGVVPDIQRIADIDRVLQESYANYADFIQPAPLSVAEAQSILKSDEHIVIYFETFNVLNAAVIGKTGAPVILQSIAWTADATRLATALRQSLTAPGRGDTAPFDAKSAQQLEGLVFAPVAKFIPKGDKVLLMPDAALASVPFETFLEGPPVDLSDRGLARAPWLGNDYRFATLPSIAALRALRRYAPRSEGRQPFLGFGDPQLLDHGGRDLRGGFSALPGTRRELETDAKIEGAGSDALYLGDKFTKAVLRDLDSRGVLRDARIVAFASHTGWFETPQSTASAAPLPGGGEARAPTRSLAIVLTPVGTEAANDEGYLTIGDIAKLSLDADWVVLSACNTAADDGSPNALPLSGLARAFFHAKARALLVSHWELDDNAAAALTPVVLKDYAASHSRAGALAQAEASIRAEPGFGHPYFWAPFVVVGDPGD